ncbi:hypothetical protein N658DRAFT_512993 [Parathielavia hyrcaniae]|uniref:Fibroin-3 related protein n=1 Tax=Parathielavia hyrcaniae TaxID=113614 RepID=A0AAN6QC71_9PEZI|nr:hypothetical protein N658DRAFT_512993 [Parathielavia hyrcaniae]
MERTLRRGFLDLFVASLRPALGKRDIEGTVTDVKTAFSSWDNCMLATYCKWPVIAVIIIGGLIVIAVAWCIIRCACCGLSCCCSCFSCLKCCGNCCGCCDPPRGSRSKYLDEPYIPPHHGYKSQEPMHAGFAGPTASPAPSKVPEVPQFATFDAGSKKNEDALPQMPSWEGAEHKKVLVEEEAVEMNALKKPEAAGQAAGAGAIGGAAGAVSPVGSRSPVNRSPYGPPGAGPGSSDAFFAASAVNNNDPYAQAAPAYNQPGAAYSEPRQGYGMAGAALSPGPRSPHAFNNGGYNDGYNHGGYGQAHDYPDPSPAAGGYDSYGTAQHQPYANHDTYNSPTSQGYNSLANQGYSSPVSQGYNLPASQGYGVAGHRTTQTAYEMDATPSHTPEPGPAPAPPPQELYGAEARQTPAPQGQYAAVGYGAAAAESRRSPAPQGQYGAAYTAESRRSPAPHGDNYGRGSPRPQGDYNNSGSGRNGYNNRPYGGGSSSARAQPQRQYSSQSSSNNHNGNGMHSPSSRGPAPQMRSDGAGFDFTSGYSRPPHSGSPMSGGGGGGGYRQQTSSPSVEEQGGTAYPGYKPYQPAA